MRVSAEEYLALDLEAHALFAEMPLHDVSRVDLPGGGEGRTVEDVRAILALEDVTASSAPVRWLFALRLALGRVFGWDDEARPRAPGLAARLSADQRDRSLLPPGTRDGPFELLYVFPNEAASEIRNATVHAASCMVLVPHGDGYRFYWAIYVAPVSWITPWYMALIEPFRRFVVYPTVLRRLRASWSERFGRGVDASASVAYKAP